MRSCSSRALTRKSTRCRDPCGTIDCRRRRNYVRSDCQEQDSNGRFDTNFAVIGADGAVRLVDQAAGEELIRDGVAIGATGPAYMVTRGSNDETFVTVLNADGTGSHSGPLRQGQPEGFTVGPDGAYVSTWDRNGTSGNYDDDRFHVLRSTPTAQWTSWQIRRESATKRRPSVAMVRSTRRSRRPTRQRRVHDLRARRQA